jgi:NADPH:quinone reductase-like Zn-dependent oxidoreductase
MEILEILVSKKGEWVYTIVHKGIVNENIRFIYRDEVRWNGPIDVSPAKICIIGGQGMKAVVCKRYGSPEGLVMCDIDDPVVKDNDVLIRVYATSAHIGDTRIRRADPFLVRLIFGLVNPKKNLVLGLEVSGVVSAIGKKVSKFKIGDEVFALTGFGLGGYAEYVSLPETVKSGTQEKRGLIALKPRNLSFEEAATVPAGCLTALKNIQKGNIKKGKTVLIYGASGSLGTYAIQLAKYYGAEITAVCSAKNFELVKSLGATEVIDYTVADIYSIQKKYDVVYDAVMKLSKAKIKRIINVNGLYLNNAGLPAIIENDLTIIKDLIERKQLKPIIDKIFALDEIREAHRYVDNGHKIGNVAITVLKR